MLTRVFWIVDGKAGALGIMARPSGGELLGEELLALRNTGVSALVSLLTPDEQRELDLCDERLLCEKHQIEFLAIPVADRQVPCDSTAYCQLAVLLSGYLAEGRRIVVHCRMGVGRAALMAAGILVAQGTTVDDAFLRIGSARGCSVPDTEEQREWLSGIAHLLAQGRDF